MKGRERELASSLPPGSAEQRTLVGQRISAGDVCLECGGARRGHVYFCASCLAPYPKLLDIGGGGEVLAIDGWRYCVRQTGPAIAGLSLFHAVKIGVFEYAGREQLIRFGCEDFAEARDVARQRWDRAALVEW